MKPVISIFPRNQSLGFVICRAAGAGTSLEEIRDKGFNLTSEQWTVLSSLWECEGIHQSELAANTAKDRQNVTRILSLLEKGGLINKKSDHGDRRLRLGGCT